MQGYIVNIQRVKDEDLIVSILTQKRLKRVYRFYGARHSHINIGYKIDFEIVTSLKSTIPQLRNVLVLSSPWIFDNQRFYIWQRFLKLLYEHLRDVEEVESFYFDLLEEASIKLTKQNPKRVMIEAYLKLLEFEGRLHSDFICFICEDAINEGLVLTRAFLPAHRRCIHQSDFDIGKIEKLFDSKSTLVLNDREVERLWDIVLEGL